MDGIRSSGSDVEVNNQSVDVDRRTYLMDLIKEAQERSAVEPLIVVDDNTLVDGLQLRRASHDLHDAPKAHSNINPNELFLEYFCSCQKWVKTVLDSVAEKKGTDNFEYSEGATDRIPSHVNAGSRQNIDSDLPEHTMKLSLCVEGLSDVSFLGSYNNLRVLELNVNRLKHLDALATLQYLEDLSVKDNALSSIEALSSLRRLRTLRLDSNQLTDISALANLPSLDHLAVNTNRLTSFPVFARNNRIQRLELYHNNISILPKSALPTLSLLTHLDLGRNKLSSIDGAALSSCLLLSNLVLSQNRLEQVPHPLCLPFLRTLWLSGNKIAGLGEWSRRRDVSDLSCSSAGFSGPSCPLFVPMLEKLYLQDNCLLSIPSITFVGAPVLSEIDLSFNRLSSACDLTGLLACLKLRKVHLQDNPVHSDPNLNRWLLRHCVSLQEISGKAVRTGNDPPLQSIHDYNTAMSSLRSFRRSGSWKQRSQRFINMSRNQIDEGGTSMSLDEASYPSVVQPTKSTQSFEILHLLSAMATEQNLFKQRKREEAKLMDENKINHSNRLQSSVTMTDLMNAQYQILLSWDLQDTSTCPLVMHIVSPSTCNVRSSGTIEKHELSIGISATEDISYEGGEIVHTAATKVQSCFRGLRARKKLRQALESARYVDDELDAILGGGEDDIFSGFGLDGMTDVGTLPELSTDWLAVRTGGASMVYGDHRRRKLAQSHAYDSSENIAPSTNSRPTAESKMTFSTNANLHGAQNNSRNPSGNWTKEALKPQPALLLQPPIDRMPPSNINGSGAFPHQQRIMRSSDASSDLKLPFHLHLHTPDSEAAPEYAHVTGSGRSITEDSYEASSRSAQAKDEGRNPTPRSTSSRANSDPGTLRSTRPSQAVQEAQLAEEWGIGDPTVIAAMMKRNKRMK